MDGIQPVENLDLIVSGLGSQDYGHPYLRVFSLYVRVNKVVLHPLLRSILQMYLAYVHLYYNSGLITIMGVKVKVVKVNPIFTLLKMQYKHDLKVSKSFVCNRGHIFL